MKLTLGLSMLSFFGSFFDCNEGKISAAESTNGFQYHFQGNPQIIHIILKGKFRIETFLHAYIKLLTSSNGRFSFLVH